MYLHMYPNKKKKGFDRTQYHNCYIIRIYIFLYIFLFLFFTFNIV